MFLSDEANNVECLAQRRGDLWDASDNKSERGAGYRTFIGKKGGGPGGPPRPIIGRISYCKSHPSADNIRSSHRQAENCDTDYWTGSPGYRTVGPRR